MMAVIAGAFIVDALVPGISVWAYMAIAMLLGVAIMIMNARLQKKAVDAASDERTDKIAGEAALFTYRIFMALAILAMVVFFNLAVEKPEFVIIAKTLFVTYMTVLAIYAVTYAIKKARG
jgi:uncharacterized membrane protein